jgi:U1 small nuclear ribonucleoprotein
LVTRQHKNTADSDLRREFETYGTIERVRIVRDKKGRSRGYAFIVYERERDMKGYSLFLPSLAVPPPELSFVHPLTLSLVFPIPNL